MEKGAEARACALQGDLCIVSRAASMVMEGYSHHVLVELDQEDRQELSQLPSHWSDKMQGGLRLQNGVPAPRSTGVRPPAAFAPGASVEYNSHTYKQWMPTTVTKVAWNESEFQWLYETEVKSEVKESKLRRRQSQDSIHGNYMREVPSPTPGANAALGGSRANDKRDSTASNISIATVFSPSRTSVLADSEFFGTNSPCHEPMKAVQDFKVNDHVWYYSETHQLEIQAIIQELLPGGFYKLDVKNKAPRGKLRQRIGGNAASEGSRIPAYAPVTSSQMEAEASMSIPPSASQRSSNPSLGSREQGPLRTPAAEVEQSASKAPVNLGDNTPTSHVQGQSVVGTVPTLTKPRTFTSVVPQSAAVEALVSNLARASICSTAATQGAFSPVSSPSSSPKIVSRNDVQASNSSGHPQGADVAGRATPKFFMGTGVESKSKPPATSAAFASSAGTTAVSSTSVVGQRQGSISSVPSQPMTFARNPQMATPGLEGGDILCMSSPFDPTSEHIRSQLLVNFQLTEACKIEEMVGFRGGLNEGVWFMKEPAKLPQDYVLKLVRCKRIASNVLTEAENCLKLLREQKGIASDPALSFPIKVFNCLDAKGERLNDLIVMKKVRGERLTEHIAHRWHGKQFDRVYQIMDKVGYALAEFHGRYGNIQHGDFQPSNIFWDEERSGIFLIDIGGMGVPCMDNDIEHFQKALKLLADSYKSPELYNVGIRHFEQGYNRCPKKRPSQAQVPAIQGQWSHPGR